MVSVDVKHHVYLLTVATGPQQRGGQGARGGGSGGGGDGGGGGLISAPEVPDCGKKQVSKYRFIFFYFF